MTTQLTFSLPTAERSQEVADRLNAIGFVATAPPEPIDGLGYLVDVLELHVGEIVDVVLVMRRLAPDSHPVEQ